MKLLLLFLCVLLLGAATYYLFTDDQKQKALYTDTANQLANVKDDDDSLRKENGILKEQLANAEKGRVISDMESASTTPAVTYPPIPDTITTLSGQTYSGCKLIHVYPDGISFEHSQGVAKVAFTDLDSSFAKTFNYDPVAGQKYEAAQAQQAAASDAMVTKTIKQQQQQLQPLHK